MPVITYKKYDDIQLGKYIHLKEMNCKCFPNRSLCNQTLVASELVECFDKLRDMMGVPLRLNSGYRCAHRNSITDGANPKSKHMEGKAVDIHWSFAIKKKFTEDEIAKMIVKAGFVYHYFRPAKNFFHCNT